MKKVLVIAVMTACMFNLVSAQDKQESFKPKAGDFSLEVGFAPFSQYGIINEGALAGFIHFTDKLAMRIGLEFGFRSWTNDNGETGKLLEKNKNSSFALTLSPGVVYSFKGTPRLTPYIGGGLNVGFISTTLKGEEGDATVKITHPEGYGDAFVFGLGAATGFNYYFAKKLYVGAEVGLNFNYLSMLKEKVTYTGMGISDPPKPKDKHHGVGLDISAYPLLRLGWTF